MSSGIRSPWAAREKPKEDPLAGARKGRQAVPFVGRAYTLLVELPFRIDEDKAQGLAMRALSDCLAALAARTPETLTPALARQSLALNERPSGPAIDLPLPDLTVWGAASSTNEGLARAMLVDRLALVLSEVERATPAGRDTLKAHYVTPVRTA